MLYFFVKLNNINRINLELIYSKRTFINVLNDIIIIIPYFSIQRRFSLVNLLNIQALAICIDAISINNNDVDECGRVYENVCIHIMDGKKGTGELLEQPPNGHATPTAIKNFSRHMEFVFNDVLASPHFSKIDILLITLGQGLTEEVNDFKKWLLLYDITGIDVRAARSTYASEEAAMNNFFWIILNHHHDNIISFFFLTLVKAFCK